MLAYIDIYIYIERDVVKEHVWSLGQSIYLFAFCTEQTDIVTDSKILLDDFMKYLLNVLA